MLHVICTRLQPGHLSVGYVLETSWRQLHQTFAIFTSSSFSAFPSLYLEFTTLGEILAYVTLPTPPLFIFNFFNPTTVVVTFSLREWCTLGVFLLSVFTRQNMKVRIFCSSPWNACVHRLDLGLYSQKVLANEVGTQEEKKKKKKSSTGKPR